MRYQFYREHKYVSAALNDVERLIAQTDFRDIKEAQEVENAFAELSDMLKGHAQYENERLHTLLEKKHSNIHQNAGEDHVHQEQQMIEIQKLIQAVRASQHDDDKVSLGYKLYLTYRKFVADNLQHLHEEETIILPELQRLYTDEELQQVEASTYHIMTAEEMVHMLQVLFPYMNSSDKTAFLSDIYDTEAEKFAMVWEAIAPMIEEKERSLISQRLMTALPPSELQSP